jgi:hypothetical protein
MWKPEAAYHEAGHALLAHVSRFHIVGPIDLTSAGNGALFVGLSRSKCIAAGKAVSAATKRDPDVARDLAVILVGGLEAEQIAAESDPGLSPSAHAAVLDQALLSEALAGAQLSRKFDRYQGQAVASLRANWPKVEALVRVLLRDGACPSEAAEKIFLAQGGATPQAP